ncbi:MAG TPA: AI-2E family transporter [Anaerolineales bacterium]|nr:AI-2E family transporter [Anaerolineales bacterium]
MSGPDMDRAQSPIPRQPGEWSQFTRQAAIVILLLGILFLVGVLRPLLNLLAITGIFILILSYPVNALRTKTKMAYPLAVVLVFIPLGILLLIIFTNMLQWAIANTRSLISALQTPNALTQAIDSILMQYPGATPDVAAILQGINTYVVTQLAVVLQFIALTGVSFFLAFLFILEMPANLARSFQSMSDTSQREFGILFDRLSTAWNGWLRSTVIAAVLVGVTTALELYVFGIPYAGILGVITGFLNLIPTFGPFVSYVLILYVTYTQGSSHLALSPAALTVLVWGVNVIINYIIHFLIFPRLAGRAVHLPVFLVILGLVVAAVLWGVVGVILVVPLLGTAREVLTYVLRKINRQEPYPGEEPHAGFWERELVSK